MDDKIKFNNGSKGKKAKAAASAWTLVAVILLVIATSPIASASGPLTTVELNYSYDKADVMIRDSTNYRGNLMRWDISSLWEDYVIHNATLCLYLTDIPGGQPDNDVTVWRVDNETWEETIPPDDVSAMTKLSETTGTLSSTTNHTWTCFDIKTQLAAAYNEGDDYLTIWFEDPDYPVESISAVVNEDDLEIGYSGTTYYKFEDRENTEGSGNRPYLNITYSPKRMWFLYNDYILYKEDPFKPEATVTVSNGSSNIWKADQATAVDVGFPAAEQPNVWGGRIFLEQPFPPAEQFSVAVGSWNESGFTPAGLQTFTGYDNKVEFYIWLSASAFTVKKGEYLALRITNPAAGDADLIIKTGKDNSFPRSPMSDPGYPYPEMSTLILFSIGLVVIAGYTWSNKRQRK